MFVPSNSEHRSLQPGDLIYWDQKTQRLWFEDGKGQILWPGEALADFAFSLPGVKSEADFESVAGLVAKVCNLTPVPEITRGFRFLGR